MNNGIVTVSTDQINAVVKRRFPGLKVPEEILENLATEASELISTGYNDAIDLVITDWANRTVKGDGQ